MRQEELDSRNTESSTASTINIGGQVRPLAQFIVLQLRGGGEWQVQSIAEDGIQAD